MIPWGSQIEIVRSLLSSAEPCRELHGVLRADHFANMALGLVAETAIRLAVAQGSPATEGQVQEAVAGAEPLVRDSALSALAAVLAGQTPPVSWAVEMGRHLAAEAELTRLAAAAPAYAEKGEFGRFAEEARKIDALAAGGGATTSGIGDIEGRHDLRRVLGIHTGVPDLDACLRGRGWLPGQLVLILGPDGGGKTHAAVSFGTAALLSGLRVHHTTLEVEEGELRGRYDRSISGIGDREFLVRLMEVKGKLDDIEKRLTILEAVDRPLGVGGLEAEILRLGAKPDLVIVDAGYLMSTGHDYAGDGAAQAQRNDLAVLHQRLRIMGQRLRVPVLTPFQANREGLKKMQGGRSGPEVPQYITRADMADALAVSRHADIVVSVNQNIMEYQSGMGRLWVDKSRGGRQFQEIMCRFQWDRSRIRGFNEEAV